MSGNVGFFSKIPSEVSKRELYCKKMGKGLNQVTFQFAEHGCQSKHLMAIILNLEYFNEYWN